jgi:hypothetical protein
MYRLLKEHVAPIFKAGEGHAETSVNVYSSALRHTTQPVCTTAIRLQNALSSSFQIRADVLLGLQGRGYVCMHMSDAWLAC